MQIEWNKDLKLGIEQLDKQRKELFKEINKSFEDLKFEVNSELVNDQKLRERIRNLLYFLTDYFITHFELEESFHYRYNSEGYEEHKILHQNIIESIDELKYEFFNKDDLEEVSEDLFIAIRGQIFILWKKHIREEDLVLKID